MVFFTSDTFFNCRNIIKLNNREKFSTIEEMNSILILQWNKTVSKTDTVYFLGNFGWDPFSLNDILPKLNGNINFLVGPYDKALYEVASLYSNCNIFGMTYIELTEYNMILSYYPLKYWPGKENGILNLHGCYNELIKTDLNNNSINCCIDYWGYKLVSLDSILDIVKTYNSIKDHNNGEKENQN